MEDQMSQHLQKEGGPTMGAENRQVSGIYFAIKSGSTCVCHIQAIKFHMRLEFQGRSAADLEDVHIHFLVLDSFICSTCPWSHCVPDA